MVVNSRVTMNRGHITDIGLSIRNGFRIQENQWAHKLRNPDNAMCQL